MDDTQKQPVVASADAAHNRLLLEWRAPEFIRHPKTQQWYIAAAVVLLALVAYALFTDSATMAIVFLVLAGVYYLSHNQPPRTLTIQISELGVFVDKAFYPYNMLSAFWVVYNPPHVRTLNLKLVNRGKLVLQLEEQNPVQIRALLAKEVPEVEGQQESATDMIIRLLKL